MHAAGVVRSCLMFLLPFLILVQSMYLEHSQGPVKYPSLLDASLETLSDGLQKKVFTSVDLVKAYILRIAEVQDDFHAVLELNPDAVSIASSLDLERARGHIRGPLHGIPVLLKDLIGTSDNMNTTAGSYALLGAKLPRDSTIARKLREAGVILLGKTSVSEWANFRAFNSSNGWSARSGQAYGPYYPGQDPWGSSTGSAIGAALGLAWASIGTETDGSIVRPASANNVVGIKPTSGLTSRNLVIPVSSHLDTIGTFARTVKDAAYLLQAIAGKDVEDNYTLAIPNIPNYVKACQISALRGVRIGVPRNAIVLGSTPTFEPAQSVAFENALDILRDAGATIVDNTNFTAAEEFWTSSIPGQLVSADFIVELPKYLSKLTRNPNNITDLSSLRAFVQQFPLEEYPDRDTGIWDVTLLGFNSTSPEFWATYQKNVFYGSEGGLLGALDRHNLDAVVMPADYAAHHFAAPVGAPVVTVPMGEYPAGSTVVKDSRGLVERAEGIPFGLSFLGRRWSEKRLIGMAYAFEQRTNFRAKLKPFKVPSKEIADVIGSYRRLPASLVTG
ncbi:hypothetical protein ONS95_011881 [Cadophora gregata]|uniref:uncharacterized protein n=1 Tax=Cadophora gregata TaxID=51156 RepID=UPI0026DB8BA6|nr:uncharacterized protein ONS95_011881 [Cadophora gregata]KAK0117542.1 hypothetical protein ONS95_011881 [Cadophora gregata]